VYFERFLLFHLVEDEDSGESSGEDKTHEGESEDEESGSDESSDDEDDEDDEEDQEEDETFENKEQLSLFRSHLKIKVYGTDIPNPFKSFDGLAKQYQLDHYLQRNILGSGFKKPTPIQMQAIPVILHVRMLFYMKKRSLVGAGYLKGSWNGSLMRLLFPFLF